jgi:hypothetical protein
MKYQVGDLIAVKTTQQEGRVVAIMDKKMIMIEIDGTEFPVFENEIEHPYFNWFTDKKFKKNIAEKSTSIAIPKEEKKAVPKASKGMQLIFFPVYKNSLEDIIDFVKVSLSNQQPCAYSFSYEFVSIENDKFSIHSQIEPFSEFYIHNISYEALATNPLFTIACAEIIENIKSTVHQYDDEFTIKPKKLFATLQDMQEKNNPFFSQMLFNHFEYYTEEVKEELKIIPYQIPKPSIIPAKQASKKQEKEILPVPKAQAPIVKTDKTSNIQFGENNSIDLHIEKICDNHQELDFDTRLEYQLNYFKKALDTAIVQHLTHIIVIHGIGKGVLKNKIHGILNQTKEVHSFVNEHSKKYGFGSTEIFFGY